MAMAAKVALAAIQAAAGALFRALMTEAFVKWVMIRILEWGVKKTGMAKKRREETLSILEHLRKDIPDEPLLEEEDELAEEEEEDDLPPVIPPTEITGKY
jgi:hypothetical protein